MPAYPGLDSPAEEIPMQEDRLVSVLRHPANRDIESLRMVRDEFAVKGPEMLLLCEVVHEQSPS